MASSVSMSSGNVIEIRNLSRCFGIEVALDNVSLEIPYGCVFGLEGNNGAGKTTLIKHVVGLLRAETGSVRVFGLDPAVDEVGVLSRIGYVSEDSDLPVNSSVKSVLNSYKEFYPTWDEAYAEDLRSQFALPPNAIVGNLSKGQKTRVAMLMALAHRPDLLVLDNPGGDLDQKIWDDVVEAIVEARAKEGGTVMFSSLSTVELERMSDFIATLEKGKLISRRKGGKLGTAEDPGGFCQGPKS